MSIFYDLKQTSNVKKSDKTFKEIKGRDLSSYSFMKQFPILKDYHGQNTSEMEYFLNIWRCVDINENAFINPSINTYYNKLTTDHWDFLAKKYYENQELWWIILLGNKIINPFEEFYDQNQLRLISNSYIYQIIKDMVVTSKL